MSVAASTGLQGVLLLHFRVHALNWNDEFLWASLGAPQRYKDQVEDDKDRKRGVGHLRRFNLASEPRLFGRRGHLTNHCLKCASRFFGSKIVMKQ